MSLKSCFYLLGLALTLALSLPAQTVRVLIVSGAADITPAGETTAHPLTKGETVTVGATITTGADGRVVLTPMPGVKSIIAPNSSITLESVSSAKNADATTAYAAVLDIKVGAVVSDLNKPADATYDYSVRTPRGLAGARGTTFTVGVNPAGISTVVVSHGTISLIFNDGRTASITPGRVSISKPDGSTVEADKVSDLSAEDQAIASNWTAITLDAIADAVDSGVELAPQTLQNVLDTAETLGVELTPAAKTTVERIKTQLEVIEKKTTTNNTNEAKELTTQVKNDYEQAKETYLASLSPLQVEVFNFELNDTEQRRLVALNNPDHSNYILDTHRTPGERTFTLALDPAPMAVFLGFDRMVQSTLISANSPTLTTYALTGTRSPADITFVANLSPADRTGFIGLPASLQALLISENNSQLTGYALSGNRSSADINYFTSLNSGQRTKFLSLSPANQTKLISANSPNLTAYALTNGRTANETSYVLALSPNQLTAFFNLDSMVQNLLISAADSNLTTYALTGTRSPADITFVANLSPADRTGFIGLPASLQALLISENNSQLTGYALSGNRSSADINYFTSLNSGQRTKFLSLSPANQTKLISANSPALTTYSLTASRTNAQINFILGLSTGQQTAFLLLSTTSQDLLASINDSVITTAALKGDNDTGLPFTSLDLNSNLQAIMNLSPSALQFFKEANGPDFNFGPGPAEWSPEAFERSAGSWNALSTSEKNHLLNYEVTESVMDRSATFLGAFIAGVQALPLNQRNAIIQTGWGYILFDEYFRDSTYTTNAINEAASLNSTQRAVVKFFDIDPYDLLFGDFTPADELDKLAALSTPTKDLLRKLDLGDSLFYSSTNELNMLYNRISSLSMDKQNAVIALGLGNYYFYYAPTDIIALSNSTTVSADQRINDILTNYLNMSPARQEALRETELFQRGFTYLGDSLFDSAGLNDFVDQYLSLSPQARRILLFSDNLSFYDVYYDAGEGLRTVSEFNDLVNGLTNAELNTLRDINGTEILLYGLFNEQVNVLTTIKTAIAFYDGLNTQQKFTMRELGIVEQYEFDWLTTNQSGLKRLLTFYSALSGNLRAGTTYLDPSYAPSDITINSDNVFLSTNTSVYNISFSTTKPNLYIGAVKNLIIEGNDTFNGNPTFQTGANGALFLHAGDLIDLNYVSFGSNIRSITMEAATINLANINFPNQTRIALNSQIGALNFGSSVVGKVNFISNVSYADNPIFDQTSFNSFGKNITIGTLNNPATPKPYVNVPNGSPQF